MIASTHIQPTYPRFYEELGWLSLCLAVFTSEKALVFILQKDELTTGPVLTRSSEKIPTRSSNRDRTRALQPTASDLPIELRGALNIVIEVCYQFVKDKKFDIFLNKYLSKLVLGSTQPSIKCVCGGLPGGKDCRAYDQLLYSSQCRGCVCVDPSIYIPHWPSWLVMGYIYLFIYYFYGLRFYCV